MTNNMSSVARAVIVAGWNDLVDLPLLTYKVRVDVNGVGHSDYEYSARRCPTLMANVGLTDADMTLTQLSTLKRCVPCDGYFLPAVPGSHAQLLHHLVDVYKAVQSAQKSLAAGADNKTRESRTVRLRRLIESRYSTPSLTAVRAAERPLFERIYTRVYDDAAAVMAQLGGVHVSDAERTTVINRYAAERNRWAGFGAEDPAPVLVGIADVTSLATALRADVLALAVHRHANTAVCAMQTWLAHDLMCDNARRNGPQFVFEIVPDPGWSSEKLDEVTRQWSNSCAGARHGDRTVSLRSLMAAGL